MDSPPGTPISSLSHTVATPSLPSAPKKKPQQSMARFFLSVMDSPPGTPISSLSHTVATPSLPSAPKKKPQQSMVFPIRDGFPARYSDFITLSYGGHSVTSVGTEKETPTVYGKVYSALFRRC
uniref:Uncharacterized protein LOC101491122 n=1 Tax=Cicer arietinum TaxID=3827 RepID=A0A1S2Z4D3_CICAR|nr:uncharacterized protein LOC101491122 [Cicer arietinum]